MRRTRARTTGLRQVAIGMLLAGGLLPGGAAAATAQPETATKTVHYHGYALTVPASWPVFRLTRGAAVCVRFDRHVVYLGTPGSQASCPPVAIGRTGAVLVEPLTATNLTGAATGLDGATVLVDRVAGVLVLRTHRGVRTVPDRARISAAPRSSTPPARAVARFFTGLGFDACSAPSEDAMSAWVSGSPYRAIGVYIGGVNAACAQPNLTESWVGTEITAGWHLIPTYVGLQAPGNSCGCSGISPASASSEGAAAAADAVADAQDIGIAVGNPIYYDMEGYNRTSRNTSAVLAFLSAWTTQLHADGYLSGVYSSADSGIADLVAAQGTSFTEPDDIWIADWNGQQTTSDGVVPASDWLDHQRLHQYQGAHNETHGGVTINVDSDYLDGAVDASAPVTTPPPPPSVTVSPAAGGTVTVRVSWAGSGATQWRLLAGASSSVSSLIPINTLPVEGTSATLTLAGNYGYFAAQALDASGNVVAASPAVATPPHVAIFGHSAFVSLAGRNGGLPVGCFTGQVCRASTTITAGHTVVATAGPELIASDRGGILDFKLTRAGATALARAGTRGLAVQASIRDSSRASATVSLNLIPFAGTGHGPSRSVAQAPELRLVGLTDFVSNASVGGILAGCFEPTPCAVATTLTEGRRVIATAGPEQLGSGEVGYLFFTLTPWGRALLTRSKGNMLPASVRISDATETATARIGLVAFR